MGEGASKGGSGGGREASPKGGGEEACSDSLVGIGELAALRAVWNEEVLGEAGSSGRWL